MILKERTVFPALSCSQNGNRFQSRKWEIKIRAYFPKDRGLLGNKVVQNLLLYRQNQGQKASLFAFVVNDAVIGAMGDLQAGTAQEGQDIKEVLKAW